MIVTGTLIAESPIYRGNARKTLFTRDGDGKQRLVSLAGEISGTAEALMDAFIGQSRNGRNTGLLNQLWQRLYGAAMPQNLINRVDCQLKKECYPRDSFFDLRMGLRLDEDRWAAEANANYKYETLFRNASFNLKLDVNDAVLKSGDNDARLYYVLKELEAGRFWFGAGKSKGLGKCRLELGSALPKPAKPPRLSDNASHLRLTLTFDAQNPILVEWNWGKLDPAVPAFAAVEGRLLVGAIRTLPEAIRQRLEMGMAGPILSPENWKQKLTTYLPKVIAIWLREQSSQEIEGWVLPAAAVNKLSKGKHAISQKVIARVADITNKTFASREEAETALAELLGKKANLAKRFSEVLVRATRASQEFSADAWRQIAEGLGFSEQVGEELAGMIHDEEALTARLAEICKPAYVSLFQQVDRQIRLLQSDPWINVEIANREDHLRIKTMLLNGEIKEEQWRNVNDPPAGIKPAAWREFLDSHRNVKYQHLLNRRNLEKSITNDRNHIAFLETYRNRARQELAQTHNTDFREGGLGNREVSRRYGKPYDTVFMRMLVWSPSAPDRGEWQVYIPGSTIKGAMRKRASQILKTLWGNSSQTDATLDLLFGRQGQRGLIYFSDAHLSDPQSGAQAWCSMDSVRMDPRTAQPVEEAKADYLYGFGDKLVFTAQLDLQDLDKRHLPALSLLSHLLSDFASGEVPLGGEKTNGFGWVQAKVSQVEWLAAGSNTIGEKLLGHQAQEHNGLWQQLTLQGDDAAVALAATQPLTASNDKVAHEVPRASQGFVSHRAFGGHCGVLALQGEVLTPLHVRESGEPTFVQHSDEGAINGWDFFSMAGPEAANRGDKKRYALPSKSLRGMTRHLYSIASNSSQPSQDIAHLNPTDGLFGFVGTGPNQALAGRLSFSFGYFEQASLQWFKVPYPYGFWQFVDGKWQEIVKSRVKIQSISDSWRLFPHAPLAPNVKTLTGFQPDTPKASYFQAIMPGARSRFTIRFWNLEKTELQRLLWCLLLEPNLAHKMGKNRYLGFGSIRFHLQPESYLTNWQHRYDGSEAGKWKQPLHAAEWLDHGVIEHHSELQKLLDADTV